MARVLNSDYAKYWGAALAVDLNNPTNTPTGQLAYKASEHGVTGFQFTFQQTGTSPVRMSYKIRDTAGTLVEYCLDLLTATAVVRFTDARQQCYAAVPGPALTPALADRIETIQWQVPTYTTQAQIYSYCITDIKPITQ